MQQSEQVRFVDQISALGFVQLPVAVLRDSRLSDGALITYSTLLVYARQDQKCWPGLGRLATDRGLCSRSISAHISELKKVRLITTTRRPGTSQVYWVIPMWNVYGQEDAPHRFTEEALGYCNLDDEGRIPRRKDVKASKDVPEKPPVPMADVALGMAAATQRTEERRVARGKKSVERQAAKVDTKAAKVERDTGLTPHKLESHWVELYTAKWPKLPKPEWGPADRRTARNIVVAYPELALEVCERVIEHWNECARRWNLDGVPSIRLVWGYRETLFAEAAQGLPPGGPKSEAMRADEFDADGEHLGKTGW